MLSGLLRTVMVMDDSPTQFMQDHPSGVIYGFGGARLDPYLMYTTPGNPLRSASPVTTSAS